MINAVKGLKLVENTIMTATKHPTDIPNYGQAHRQLTSIYDELVGGTKMFNDCRNGKLGEDAGWKFLEKIMNLTQSKTWIGANIKKQVGKHKIPRYLYHVTTKSNYESMLKTGTLRVSNESGLGSGVFMLELQNMIKHYGNHKGYRGLERLLGQGRFHQDSELVLLKIPTAKLDASRLSIRDNGMPSVACIPDLTVALGDSAVSSKLYKQRKVGLEYIYPHDIPINEISVVGSAKTKDLAETMSDTEALEIWKTLTQGNPEHRAFEVLG